MDFNNLKELEVKLRSDVNSILINEISDIAKVVIQANVDDVVYSSYDPKIYERRYSSGGGLGDIDNISSTLESDGVLVLKNETQVNDAYGGITSGYLDAIVTSGNGYAFGDGSEPYTQPRDFYQAAEEDLRNGILEKTLRSALKSRGYTTT